MISRQSETINIFLNTDNNYAVPAYITLYSLIHNYHGKNAVNVYFLTPGDMSSENRSFLLRLSDSNPLFEIFFIDMKDAYSNVTMNQRFVCTILYRLMIPRIVEQKHLKIDKCMYLDVDTVVEGDITELYNMDSKWDTYSCGGVRDLLADIPPDYKDKLGIPSLDKYINAGVLLINLKYLNNSGLRDKLEEAGYHNEYMYHDQDAINSVCHEGIKLIPLKYNLMPQVFYDCNSEIYEKYGKKEAAEAKKKPVIIHYIGAKKPWSYNNMYLAGKWWKYVRMQDEKTIKDFITPFLEAHKITFSGYDIAKTILINILIGTRLIGPIRKIRPIV